ncbi:MAG TPA: hypothetical protein PKV72_02090 [Candidatus Peribacteria bacterium]|nr:hypothetical protein [Candidatus Peribacteria bacterium]
MKSQYLTIALIAALLATRTQAAAPATTTTLKIDVQAEQRYEPKLPPVSQLETIASVKTLPKVTSIGSIAMRPDGKEVAVATDVGAFLISIKDGTARVVGNGKSAIAACYTPDGEPVVAFWVRHKVKETTYPNLLRPAEKRVTETSKASVEIHLCRKQRPLVIQLWGWNDNNYYTPSPNGLSVSPDGGTLAVGTSAGLKLVGLEQRKLLPPLKADAKIQDIYRLSYLTKQKADVSVRGKGQMVLDLETGKLTQVKEEHAVTKDGGVRNLGTSYWRHNGLQVNGDWAVGYCVSIVRLWNTRNNKIHELHHGWSSRVNGAVYTPDGRQLVTVVGYNADNKDRRGVYVWDVETGKLTRVLYGREESLLPY